VDQIGGNGGLGVVASAWTGQAPEVESLRAARPDVRAIGGCCEPLEPALGADVIGCAHAAESELESPLHGESGFDVVAT
jgi:hypothetical protein